MLSELTGISKSHVSVIERGESNTTVDYLVRIASVYQKSLDALIGMQVSNDARHPDVDLENQELTMVQENITTLYNILVRQNK